MDWRLLRDLLSQDNGKFGPTTSKWRGQPVTRVQTFVWCAMKGKILSRAALNRRGMLRSDDDLCCPLCGFEEEETSHLFTVCPLAKHQWTSFSNLMGVSWVFERTCGGIIDSWVISNLGHKSKVAWNTIPMTILWYVWKRGTLEFSKTKRDTNDIFQMDKWRLGA